MVDYSPIGLSGRVIMSSTFNNLQRSIPCKTAAQSVDLDCRDTIKANDASHP